MKRILEIHLQVLQVFVIGLRRRWDEQRNPCVVRVIFRCSIDTINRRLLNKTELTTNCRATSLIALLHVSKTRMKGVDTDQLTLKSSLDIHEFRLKILDLLKWSKYNDKFGKEWRQKFFHLEVILHASQIKWPTKKLHQQTLPWRKRKIVFVEFWIDETYRT